MFARTQRGITRYLRQHSTRDLQIMIRCSKAEKDRPRDPKQMMLVQVFPIPGPEHERPLTPEDRAKLLQASVETGDPEIASQVETMADGPEPLVFFAPREVAQEFVKNLDRYRAEAGGRR
jgi:hypothetical protein